MSGRMVLLGFVGACVMFGIELAMIQFWTPPTAAAVTLSVAMPALGLAGGYLVGYRLDWGDWW